MSNHIVHIRRTNVDNICKTLQQIKTSIMNQQLIRLHQEALENLIKQEELTRTLKDLDPSYHSLRALLEKRLNGLINKYAIAQTELFKILNTNK